MKKTKFSGYAITEEIKENTIIWTKQTFNFMINDINNMVDWVSKDVFLIKSPEDVKYIDHYYPLSHFLFQCEEMGKDKHIRLLNEFCVKRLFLLDNYTYDRLEKGIYPFCAPCIYKCIFPNKYGARLVKCLKKTYKTF